MPLVSVIIRTYRRPWFLTRALGSIISQAVMVEVVIVCDGGLDEEVKNVIGGFQASGMDIKEVVLPKQMGRSASWNAGWRVAKGEWLAALDDDDTWEPNFLREVLAEIALRGGGTGFGVATQTLEIRERADGDTWSEVERFPFNPALKTVRLTELVLRNLFTNNAFVFPRAALAEVGEVREDMDLLEDWDFNTRFAARFPIHVIARPLAHYRRRPAGRGEAWANTDSALHRAAFAAVRETWIRDDVRAGRLSLGELTLLAEIRSNLGLRLFNRVGSFLRELGGRR